LITAKQENDYRKFVVLYAYKTTFSRVPLRWSALPEWQNFLSQEMVNIAGMAELTVSGRWSTSSEQVIRMIGMNGQDGSESPP
jgi:hypothetical protein